MLLAIDLRSVFWLGAFGIVYSIGLGIYRLYFHPLAKIPGPKLAGLTQWYATYHDLIRGGQYTHVIEAAHRKYGPVIRIMPDVVHINDPSFVDKLYPPQHPGHIREKPWTLLNLFLVKNAVLNTQNHDLHRRRRAVMSKFFSKENVRQLGGVIDETLRKLLARMENVGEVSGVLVVNDASRAATKDIIQSYALGEGDRCLDKDDFNATFFKILTPGSPAWVSVHFHWLSQAMVKLPKVVLKKLSPSVSTFADWMESLEAQVRKILDSKEAPEKKTIFHEIRDSGLPVTEKTPERLLDEAMVLAVAGADTTAQTLTALVYHVLSDTEIFRRLREELDSVMPDPNLPPEPVKLDQLTYLNALIEECLRFHPSAVHRQDRYAPNEDLVFEYADGRTLLLPRGTNMGMNARTLNRHPAWFGDDADTFRPDRFIENPKLLRKMFTFGKGGRQCLGMNLAYQELQTFTAGIFRKYRPFDPKKGVGGGEQGGPTLELFETTERDVTTWADYITAAMHPDSKGVRVRVRA